MFLSVITVPIVLARIIDILIRRCNVNQIVSLQIRSATPIQDMSMSAPIYWRWRVISATTANKTKYKENKNWDALQKFATLRLFVETMPI
jgi:hypothetical protein